MKKISLDLLGVLTLLVPMAMADAYAADVNGAGATFPAAIYNKWAENYKVADGSKVFYQGVGSGAGINLIAANKVDFGASDQPLKAEDLIKNHLVQFPVVIGGVVPFVNIAGIEAGQLKLDGKTLAAIYMGKITKWNDPAIAVLNKDIKLPDEIIAVMHRSDASGSTFIFTNFLSKVSHEWKAAMGEGATTVSWKSGTGALGGDKIVNYVQKIKNSIGYVDFNKVKQDKLAYVQLLNHDGQYVKPDIESIRAAAANAQWDMSKNFYEILTDQPGNTSWPITGATYILMHKTQDNPMVGLSVLKFFDWGFYIGSNMAEELSYVPLPEKLKQKVRAEWAAQITDINGTQIWK
jgi:phosphate transport system substrate-binding protein